MIHIVLHEIDIPQNAGNIMRTCAATNTKLHLIEPLGFIFNEERVRRSAMDYFDHLTYERYMDWKEFTEKNPGKYIFFTKFSNKNFYNINLVKEKEDIYLIFGSESRGLPRFIHEKYSESLYCIPMKAGIRSLNLANSVALSLYEVLRQQSFSQLKD